MTEIQYLKMRIKDLERGLNNPLSTPAEQKRQALALVNYRLDLKRVLENKSTNQAH
ncbi:MAG: hypothetical protein IJZ88_04685 [Clostridia bacterium]|nr:hypothetical protein [Clostridia bacterium]